eukprot:TRINITY_DN32018_c0_g2_i3.p1 TRINITY_DN32018_c0_g2~~TRINITY_DN32018_c0_g2_i3.p1  ORF type:complete len:373 (+),score=46.16 TRINITY_DN32018_c0_g2_i3:162-1280(+)
MASPGSAARPVPPLRLSALRVDSAPALPPRAPSAVSGTSSATTGRSPSYIPHRSSPGFDSSGMGDSEWQRAYNNILQNSPLGGLPSPGPSRSRASCASRPPLPPGPAVAAPAVQLGCCAASAAPHYVPPGALSQRHSVWPQSPLDPQWAAARHSPRPASLVSASTHPTEQQQQQHDKQQLALLTGGRRRRELQERPAPTQSGQQRSASAPPPRRTSSAALCAAGLAGGALLGGLAGLAIAKVFIAGGSAAGSTAAAKATHAALKAASANGGAKAAATAAAPPPGGVPPPAAAAAAAHGAAAPAAEAAARHSLSASVAAARSSRSMARMATVAVGASSCAAAGVVLTGMSRHGPYLHRAPQRRGERKPSLEAV